MLKEHTLERDRIELSTGDVLDVKAGLLLVMLIFLAEQLESIFRGDLTLLQKSLEWVSILGLIFGGLLAILQLIPKKYDVLSLPTKYQKWLDELRKHYSEEANPEREVLKFAEEKEITQAIERVEKNRDINKKKVRLAKLCFYCVIASFSANIAVLAIRHLSQLCR